MSKEQPVEQARRAHRSTDVRALLPARYSAWLSGDLGRRIERDLNAAILDVHRVPGLVVRRITGGIIVQADEKPGAFVGSLSAALVAVERGVRDRYPAMRSELGSLFTGSLQVLLPDPEFQGPRETPSGAGPSGPPQPGR